MFPPVPYEIAKCMVSIFIFLSVIGTSFRHDDFVAAIRAFLDSPSGRRKKWPVYQSVPGFPLGSVQLLSRSRLLTSSKMLI
jgi:hypothetical protein